MNATFEYDAAETAAIVLKDHLEFYGSAPDGYVWESEAYYYGVKITLKKIVEVSDEHQDLP